MDFALGDEQQLIRGTARDPTDNEIVPRAKENARNAHFDVDLVRHLAGQGYLGAIAPREDGGAGLDYLTYGLIVEEVGRGGSAMRTVVSVLDPRRYSVAAGGVGSCQGCVDESVAYATGRRQFDRPIASFQLVQAMLAEYEGTSRIQKLVIGRALTGITALVPS